MPENDSSDFCCNGCQTVYGLLQSCGLSDYYRIRADLGTQRPARPVSWLQHKNSFAFLDDPEQVTPRLDADGQRSLSFYLEGVHCAACIWLVEQLPTFLPDVASARLNLASSEAEISLKASGRFETVADLLLRWGYRPHLVQENSDRNKHARRDQILMLSRIGVAAFAAGNLMILAVALYAGVDGPLAHYFEWLSLLLALPALTFSAWPFYQQAWGQLRHSRQVSIDVPIALSLVLGSLGGTYELFWGTRQIYFDSLATLVFLLLLSRYTLLRTQQQVLRSSQLLSFYTAESVTRQSADGSWQAVPVTQIQSGDTIQVAESQRFPVDGVVRQGESLVDETVLTGEPFPKRVGPGDNVYCGTRNQRECLEISVTATADDTRLGQILLQAQHNLGKKTHLMRLVDRLARYFMVGVLGLSALLFIGLGLLLQHPQEALVRILALAIIACPCALALATPLTVQIALKRALSKGFFVRNPDALERLPNLKTLVFDKTGTLTLGRFEILQAEGFNAPDVQAAVLALESHSRHPVARTLVQAVLKQQPQPIQKVQDFSVIPSGGIAGQLASGHWQIVPDPDFESGSPLQSAGTALLRLKILHNDHLRASLTLGDPLRPEAPEVLRQLRAAGYQIYLLSGDQPAACSYLAQQVGIAPACTLSQQSPEAKEQFLQSHPDAVMIGDGLNDLLAMSKARVSISVQGSAEENLQHGDIYLAEQGLSHLPNLLWHARTLRRLLKVALGFSLTYNMLGISAAVLGFVSPLVAAIVMPFSALSVFGLALIGGHILCKS
ncbi:MAG: heavy metal translocating P-type ATPase [Candidatus Sericytochromatia bacterium]|nr:heavy metal translocating P-type ATPase [Candidatus Sericytochromatia bacterium]